jgi:hypothetical protein
MMRRFPFIHMPEILIESRWHDEQTSKKGDHQREATAFWSRMLDEISDEEKIRLEGSTFSFMRQMAIFFERNNLPDAATSARSRAENAVSSILVSIVIPVHNRIDFAITAIESAAAQTHPSIEIIVVDDGSSDDFDSLSRAVTRLGSRGRLVRQANRGPAAARNAGWALAQGIYVAFLDADDLLLPGKVAHQLREMEEAGAVFSHTSYQRYRLGEADLTRVASGVDNLFPAIIGSCGIATPTVMLRRDLWERGYRFPENFRYGEDIVLWLTIAARHGMLGIDRALSIVRTSSRSAAFDRTKQAEGVANILAAVQGAPELAHFASEVARLARLAADLARLQS